MKITTVTKLLHSIGQYYSMYDYELLEGLVESTGCKEASE